MNEHKNEKSQEEKEEEVIDRLDSLDIVKTIGTGSFATVKLCKHVMTRQCFALKTMSILEMIKMKQVQHVKNEKKVLQQVNHPFIIKLMWSHIDKSSIHFLFPFVNGGELFYHLRKCERFPVNRVRFYSSEIVSALAYLHSLKIVYRDLKPENILLDSQGHIVLTDFGFAKTISDLSWTVCGTPDYLAPEVIQSRGHNKSVDWWALGILIYEMMHGYPPFYDDNNLGLYRKILSSPYYWRLSSKDTGCRSVKDIVRRLITRDTTRRLGCMKRGSQDVMEHRFFADIDWDLVTNKQLQPPFIPSVSSDDDTSYFLDYSQEDLNESQLVNESNHDYRSDFFKDF